MCIPQGKYQDITTKAFLKLTPVTNAHVCERNNSRVIAIKSKIFCAEAMLLFILYNESVNHKIYISRDISTQC